MGQDVVTIWNNLRQMCPLSCFCTNTGDKYVFLECQQASAPSSIDVPFTHTIAMWLSERKPFTQ